MSPLAAIVAVLLGIAVVLTIIALAPRGGASAALGAPGASTTAPAPGSADQPLRVHLVSGSAEYHSDETLAAFQQYLETNYRVTCTRSFAQDKGDDLPGLEALDRADVMLLYTRRLTLPPDQLGRIQKYFADGRPVVGLRTASHAIQNWLAFDKEVLHGNYIGHYGVDEPAQIKLVEANKNHPLLTGVPDFVTGGKLYKNPDIDAKNTLLLTGTNPKATEPIAWTRDHNGGRVFYTSLGTPDDFKLEPFQRLLVNALFWTAKREVAKK